MSVVKFDLRMVPYTEHPSKKWLFRLPHSHGGIHHLHVCSKLRNRTGTESFGFSYSPVKVDYSSHVEVIAHHMDEIKMSASFSNGKKAIYWEYRSSHEASLIAFMEMLSTITEETWWS